jgi:hypothetical protein
MGRECGKRERKYKYLGRGRGFVLGNLKIETTSKISA